MAITIFRTINGNVVPITVSSAIDSFPEKRASRLPKFATSKINSEYFQSVEAYTIPNAQCPVCGALVFYYEHTNGSKVYFEELGPPWPKHPCTDNPRALLVAPKLISKHEKPSVVRNVNASQTNWVTNGWKPSTISSLKEVTAGVGIANSVEAIIVVTNTNERIKCTFKHSSLKKLKLNKNSLKKSLIQSLVKDDEHATVSVHSGVASIEVTGVIQRRNLQKTHTDVALEQHRLELTDVRAQLPNSDGNLTLLFAKMNGVEAMLVFDMNNGQHFISLDQILRSKQIKLSICSRYVKPRWGTNVTLELNTEALLELPIRAAYEVNKFLSPSQKAEKISEKKQRSGGNSAVADAFAKALKNT
ncbi:hypothetical protein CGH25_05640 [Vibrio parahaemolyticus]|uniref:hypothetical protein n=2 Tax=Vibrio parahaemolyticus TaxID=670 RepID=UPI00111E084A|nr:hypothetical protein [Vibrio parahaemolyticus]MDF5280159.1 hypothetical protein [Vibrio parahaemolyticus]NMU71904.1 hypothetical protein [Vibrio parahaemolyticus]TOO95601.1 hypothetical protein CGH25_05640 [Vibrio parahaemolyticus]TOP02673.1 hypothetical protein CGH24_02680 [Vibrio parahaemolyticus]